MVLVNWMQVTVGVGGWLMRMLFGKNWNFQKVRNSNYLEVTAHSETICFGPSPLF